jgi:hypothetical protein
VLSLLSRLRLASASLCSAGCLFIPFSQSGLFLFNHVGSLRVIGLASSSLQSLFRYRSLGVSAGSFQSCFTPASGQFCFRLVSGQAHFCLIGSRFASGSSLLASGLFRLVSGSLQAQVRFRLDLRSLRLASDRLRLASGFLQARFWLVSGSHQASFRIASGLSRRVLVRWVLDLALCFRLTFRFRPWLAQARFRLSSGSLHDRFRLVSGSLQTRFGPAVFLGVA